LYHDALDCGISINEFWALAIPEVLDKMKSHKRIKLREQKSDINICFLQARLIGEYLGKVWDPKIKISHQWDIFPELFAEDQAIYEAAREREEFEGYKERRRLHAIQHNLKMKAFIEG